MIERAKINTAASIFYSPTGTTEKIIKEITERLKEEGSVEVEEFNITTSQKRNHFGQLKRKYDLIIVGAPVYEGRIPKNIREFLRQIHFKNSPTIAIVTYGNRTIGSSLQQLTEILIDAGAHVYGIAAFIGEHSFSTPDFQIAKNRPDAVDLKIAKQFAAEILKKGKGNRHRKLNPNGIYSKMGIIMKIIPEGWLGAAVYPSKVNKNKCTECKLCAKSCPVNAINQKTLMRNKKNCTHCMACVNSCKSNAIRKKSIIMPIVRQFLKKSQVKRREPAYYINTYDSIPNQPLKLYSELMNRQTDGSVLE